VMLTSISSALFDEETDLIGSCTVLTPAHFVGPFRYFERRRVHFYERRDTSPSRG
jgi:hypothetical protein